MVKEGDLLWTPSAEWVAGSNLVHFMKWLQQHRGLNFTDYAGLWHWSVTDIEAFWGALWEYCEVQASVPYQKVLGRSEMPGADWFPGARLNYAQNILRSERPATPRGCSFFFRTPGGGSRGGGGGGGGARGPRRRRGGRRGPPPGGGGE